MKNKLLEVTNLSKTYHDLKTSTKAIDNISFDIYEGEILSIVGPSGCGKSTILSILSNITNKSSGKIIFNKEKIIFSYMLQKDCLFPWLTILDNCLLGLKINKCLTKDNINYVKSLLNKYGLHDFMYKYPNSLSGGMKQRASLIRTLAMNPDILLLDEATSALDYQTALHITDDIYNIIKKEKKTAVIVTHDISIAASISDRVIVLSQRPCKIKKVYNIELTNKSTPLKNRSTKEFNIYFNNIWRDLDEQ